MKKIIVLLLISYKMYSQQWYPMGAGVTNNNPYGCVVFDINEFQGKIIIGGGFKKTANLIVNGIAQWNGNSWQNMTKGIWVNLESPDSVGNGGGLTEYKGNFYCSGFMEGAGGSHIGQPSHYAYNITRWNGTDWFPLSPAPPIAGFGGTCLALQVYHNNLFCGGFFDHTYDSSGIYARKGIAVWNDTVFSAVASQMSGDFPPEYDFGIWDLGIYHNMLIAGGAFTSINGSPFGSYSGIAAYNDTVWSALGTGFNNAVFTVAVLDDTLYAAGRFTASRGGGVALPRVAKWDGSNWLPVGAGFNDSVWTLEADTINHKLYAGGNFTHFGNGQPAKHLAVWDGVSWQEVGNGTDSAVYALYIKDSNLYVGGKFTHVGNGIPANRIAVWGVTNPNGVNELGIRNEELGIFPNPTTSLFTISTEGSKIKQIKIYNLIGEVLFQSTPQTPQSTIDLTEQRSGIYFVEIITQQKIIRKKIIKQ